MLKSKETWNNRTIARFDDFGYSLSRENNIEFGDNGVVSCGVEDFDFWKSAEFVNGPREKNQRSQIAISFHGAFGMVPVWRCLAWNTVFDSLLNHPINRGKPNLFT
jgi:hypothetical protein